MGDHASDSVQCETENNLCGGGKKGKGCGQIHEEHELICRNVRALTVRGVTGTRGRTFLHVMWVRPYKGTGYSAGLFDPGATGHFVTNVYARKMKFKGKDVTINVETLGGWIETRRTKLYDCMVRDKDGRIERFEAYGVDKVTSTFAPIPREKIDLWFPSLSENEKAELAARPVEADFLIGNRLASWQPDKAEKGRGEKDLFVLRSRFGITIGGSYGQGSERQEQNLCLGITEVVSHTLVTEVRDQEKCAGGKVEDSEQIFKTRVKQVEGGEKDFFQLEQMGTVVEPKCGACRCGRCPVPGSLYCFMEQKQPDLVNQLRSYNTEGKFWETEYPWKKSRETLEKNEGAAWKNLLALEKKLKTNPEWAETINGQVQDMIDRGRRESSRRKRRRAGRDTITIFRS